MSPVHRPYQRRPEDPRADPGGARGPGTPPGAPGAEPRNPLAAAHRARWYDEEAGPLVRPYAVTGGRTGEGRRFDLIALVVTEQPDPLLAPAGAEQPSGPEQARILDLCRGAPLSVAELAADLDLPVGVVRVLLGDLLAAGLIRVNRPVPPALLPDERILQEVVHGLRAL
ncbi:DUF742 domain-containing protein [Kitasatospora sp. NPDC101183]|uniref:DUF742 domain-containing protein n=1 Tax=Kitasatospora sp. NPDC101183 TaxID=3364100 RepID=UPI00380581EC